MGQLSHLQGGQDSVCFFCSEFRWNYSRWPQFYVQLKNKVLDKFTITIIKYLTNCYSEHETITKYKNNKSTLMICNYQKVHSLVNKFEVIPILHIKYQISENKRSIVSYLVVGIRSYILLCYDVRFRVLDIHSTLR